MSYQPDNRTNLNCQVHPCNYTTAYSPKLKISLTFPSQSKYTDQSFADECNINTIMARYQSTGELPQLNQTHPQYLDVTDMDFQSHMDAINEANALFASLPSKVRARFANNPADFLEFTADPENRPELLRMGLLSPEATQRIASEKNSSERTTDDSGLD